MSVRNVWENIILQLTFWGELFNLINFNSNAIFKCVIDTQHKNSAETHVYVH